MSSELDSLFTNGKLEELFPGYEKREEQILLAKRIAKALDNGEVLVAEAGTGVGKSFAYLLPSVLYNKKKEEKIVISTETIALQNQLIQKDIPTISKVIGKSIKTEIALGSGNYLCKRKMDHTIDSGNFGPEMGSHLKEFYAWEKSTESGIKSEYKGFASSDFWSKVTRDSENCLGKKCPNFDTSYYFLEKKKWDEADILIINHHLLAAHIAGEFKVLPAFSHLIIDEAHNFPDIIGRAFTQSLIWEDLEDLLRSIYQTEKKPGLSAKIENSNIQTNVKELTKESIRNGIEYFNRIISEVGLIFQPTRIIKSLKLDGGLLEKSLSKLHENLKKALKAVPEDSEELSIKELYLELERTIKRLSACIDILFLFRTRESKDRVYWVEPKNSTQSDFYKINIQFMKSENILIEHLFPNMDSIIFTSATLSSERENFSFFLESIGNPDSDSIQLDSPFPYSKNALIYMPKENSIRDPGESPDGFTADVCTIIPKLLELTQGNAFVLFTSNKMLKEAFEVLEPELPYPIFSQESLGAEKAKTQFLNTPNSVLFGVSTFWQGIDIKGNKLRSVIITKLPFQPPTDPVLEARIEAMKKEGKNPFQEIQLPRAIVTLKQGFGRLIRSGTDTGVVSILDPRIKTKFYGRKILDALPPAKRVHSFLELKKEFQRLDNLY